MYGEIKKRVYEVMEKAKKGDVSSKIFDVFIVTLISLNVLAVILETVKGFSPYLGYFAIFETTSVVIFTVEYFLRFWSSTSDNRYARPFFGRIKHIFSPLAIIDLLAILPFYLPMLLPLDLRFLRVIRLIRIFRLFKIGRYSKSLKTLGNVFKAKKEQLLITLFVVIILIVLSSSLIYHAEHKAQPEEFKDIPTSMWWSVVTLTTVGYGDVYPITPLGRFLGMIISVLGIGMFALPAGILGSGFFDEIQKQKKFITCPECGKKISLDSKQHIGKHHMRLK